MPDIFSDVKYKSFNGGKMHRFDSIVDQIRNVCDVVYAAWFRSPRRYPASTDG